ncbi:MAG TPA: gamma-glutamylcyclotransferase family protein [Opitutaceae bacterium]|nr:gamma-glutamylcyclotransferase family protein [Opitutaceae bacterium]
MPLLFVYGTLQRGCRNHRQLAGARFLGEARALPGWALYDVGGVPGLVAAPGEDSTVEGELWEIPTESLVALDRFEGVPHGPYTRAPIPLTAPAPVVAETYRYELGVHGRLSLPSRWRE